jgi:hypothetical protein
MLKCGWRSGVIRILSMRVVCGRLQPDFNRPRVVYLACRRRKLRRRPGARGPLPIAVSGAAMTVPTGVTARANRLASLDVHAGGNQSRHVMTWRLALANPMRAPRAHSAGGMNGGGKQSMSGLHGWSGLQVFPPNGSQGLQLLTGVQLGEQSGSHRSPCPELRGRAFNSWRNAPSRADSDIRRSPS